MVGNKSGARVLFYHLHLVRPGADDDIIQQKEGIAMTKTNGRRVLVVGLGKSGFAAAKLLISQGLQVSVYDEKPEENFSVEEVDALKQQGTCFFFAREPEDFPFELAVISPGISPFIPLMDKVREKGIPIIGELELAYRNCRGSFIAITGTNGKTTTTALVGEMFRLADLRYEIVGNIGLPVTDRSMHATQDTTMVTEVSSFQLETISEFRPKISAILNITPDHLDRHGSMDEYVRVKSRIFENQKAEDFFIYNADDSQTVKAAAACKNAKRVPFSAAKALDFGVCVEAGTVVIQTAAKVAVQVCETSEILIPGAHNLENALAAVAIGYYAGIPAAFIQMALRSFAGVEHRIEFVCQVKDVRYVNDSKGTNPDASEKAIQATATPILLIAGGYEKNSDFDHFIQSFEGKVKYLLLLGATAPRIAESALRSGFPRDRILFCQSMAECVFKASDLALPGDTVLLSPACASWGMYNNYEERGRDFKQLALSLNVKSDQQPAWKE
jgi:UDP-N-acetylmuramoylalanine--D-glutamate ligase